MSLAEISEINAIVPSRSDFSKLSHFFSMRRMDLDENEKFGFENRRIDSMSCQDWNQIGLSPCTWNNPSHSLSFPEAANASSSSAIGKPVPLNWSASDAVEKGEMSFSLSHFATDTGFIERAARFSCFVSDTSNAIAEVQMQMNGAGKVEAFRGRANCGSPLKDQIEVWEESHTTNKKRKKSGDQEVELNQIQDAAKDVSSSKMAERNSSTMAKPSGKASKEGEEAGKEDYIHVRARRGQATNSHSLAERVRREKISERMKFLQDLVPGCSKVTGKAVMLDEIINYVQSLQRQVEFLSMKLASVNPRLDFNLEGLLSKDLFTNRSSSSSAIEFSPDMIQHHLHSLHQGLIQVGMPGLMNPSDAFRRSVNVQLPSTNVYKDSAHQMPNAWDDDFQNVLHMTYDNNPTLKIQDLNGVPHDKYPL